MLNLLCLQYTNQMESRLIQKYSREDRPAASLYSTRIMQCDNDTPQFYTKTNGSAFAESYLVRVDSTGMGLTH
jgi:hypothetical protein